LRQWAGGGTEYCVWDCSYCCAAPRYGRLRTKPGG
jgi:hypothetical protein